MCQCVKQSPRRKPRHLSGVTASLDNIDTIDMDTQDLFAESVVTNCQTRDGAKQGLTGLELHVRLPPDLVEVPSGCMRN